LAVSSVIGASIGAAIIIVASGPRVWVIIGCCATHSSMSMEKAVLSSKATAVAMHAPHKNAAANSHSVSRSRRSRNHSKESGTVASKLENASAL
jgi:hypothetical protein